MAIYLMQKDVKRKQVALNLMRKDIFHRRTEVFPTLLDKALSQMIISM